MLCVGRLDQTVSWVQRSTGKEQTSSVNRRPDRREHRRMTSGDEDQTLPSAKLLHSAVVLPVCVCVCVCVCVFLCVCGSVNVCACEGGDGNIPETLSTCKAAHLRRSE
jgi:hypothetical protein